MINTAIGMLMLGLIIILVSTINQLRSDVLRMNLRINKIAKKVGVSEEIDEELKEAILELILKGEKVKAVKKYRTSTGAGLVEAKKYVDFLDR